MRAAVLVVLFAALGACKSRESSTSVAEAQAGNMDLASAYTSYGNVTNVCTAANMTYAIALGRFRPATPIKIRDLDRAIGGTPGSGRTIYAAAAISLLKQDPVYAYLFSCWSGVNEGYSIEEHTMRVLSVMNDQRRYYKIPDGAALDAYRLLVWTTITHDLAKPVAVERYGNTKHQHEFIPALTSKILRDLGFSPDQVALGTKLVEHDDVGHYMKGGTTLDDLKKGHASRFSELAARLGTDLAGIWEMQALFYVSDATSYPYVRNNFFDGKHPRVGTKMALPQLPEEGSGLSAPIAPTGFEIISRSGALEKLRAEPWQ